MHKPSSSLLLSLPTKRIHSSNRPRARERRYCTRGDASNKSFPLNHQSMCDTTLHSKGPGIGKHIPPHSDCASVQRSEAAWFDAPIIASPATVPYTRLTCARNATTTTTRSRNKGWKDGGFLSVQWRTETSTGNLTECYGLHVRSAVEERRLSLGFSRSQVFFNTDLVGETSTTYNATVRHTIWILYTQRHLDGAPCQDLVKHRAFWNVLTLF